MNTIEKEIEIKNDLIDIFKNERIADYEIRYVPLSGAYEVIGRRFLQAALMQVWVLCKRTNRCYYFRAEKDTIVLTIHK